VIRRLLVAAAMGLLGLAAGSTFAAIQHLAPADRDHLLRADSFSAFHSVGSIPPAVRAAFAQGVRDPSFEMASAGEAFQETDVLVKKRLPWRRLLFGALSSDHCLLHYEKGGRGHSYHVALFELSGHDARLVWRAVADRPFPALVDLRRAVAEGAIEDDKAYAW
jgi:hypothetical protein